MNRQDVLAIQHELADLRNKIDRLEARLLSLSEEAALARRQRAALEELWETLDALPLVNHNDGLSGRDHDKIIYGL